MNSDYVKRLNLYEKINHAIFLCYGERNSANRCLKRSELVRYHLLRHLDKNVSQTKIPLDLEGEFEVDGFRFKLFKSRVVTPSSKKNFFYKNKNIGESIGDYSRPHRLFIYCPICINGKLIPIGTFKSHANAHLMKLNET